LFSSCRLYSEFSQRGENHLSASEVRELLLGNNLTGTNIREDQITDMLKVFDKNGDQIITKEEFVSGLTEYINQTKHALDRQYLPKQSMNKMYQVRMSAYSISAYHINTSVSFPR
jgi:Ca2+-binding EF-hand superfamily protein